MRETLQALNCLVFDKVIEEYAIGGAAGLPSISRRSEPRMWTLCLSSIGQIRSHLAKSDLRGAESAGGVQEREYIRFGDWPLQILTDANPLIAEAIRKQFPLTIGAVGQGSLAAVVAKFGLNEKVKHSLLLDLNIERRLDDES